MKKGDIVLVPFPFTDLSATKKRPALVLISDNKDVTLAFITTRMHWKRDWDLYLEPAERNGLKKESIVRLSKITTLEKELVLGRLGTISESRLKELNKKLRILFGIS
jgi:mRNA interferase MazF